MPFLGDAMTVGLPLLLQGRTVPAHGHVHRRRRLARAAGVARRGWSCWSWGSRRARALSVDLGVASGSVSIAVGVYLRLEADKGLFTAYFRIRGEVDVLGLISASITLELSLTYHFETGKLIGRASLVVEVEVLFFSASVEISVERKLAGSKGDPTMFQVMPPDGGGMNADWAEYCGAFAPVPAAEAGGPMPTTVLATALPHSLADDAPFQLTVFLTHKLSRPRSRCPTSRPLRTGRPRWPAAPSRWTTSLGDVPPLRVVSAADAAAVGGRAAPRDPGRRLPDARAVRQDLAHQPREPDERPRRGPAPRGDHGGAAGRPASRATPWQAGCCGRWPTSTRADRCWRLLDDEAGRARRSSGPGPAAAGRADHDRSADRARRDRPRARPRRRDPAAAAVPVGDRRPPSPVQVLLDDPEARHAGDQAARRAGSGRTCRRTRSCR